jgi:hypothetical protein
MQQPRGAYPSARPHHSPGDHVPHGSWSQALLQVVADYKRMGAGSLSPDRTAQSGSFRMRLSQDADTVLGVGRM